MRVGEGEGGKRMAINEGKGNKGRRVGVGDKRKYGGGSKNIKEKMILCIKVMRKVILIQPAFDPACKVRNCLRTST